jgi:hypothetical protein
MVGAAFSCVAAARLGFFFFFLFFFFFFFLWSSCG